MVPQEKFTRNTKKAIMDETLAMGMLGHDLL